MKWLTIFGCLIILSTKSYAQAKVHDSFWIKEQKIKSIAYYSQSFSQHGGTFLLDRKFLHEKDEYDENGMLFRHEEDNLEGRVSWEYKSVIETTDEGFNITISWSTNRFNRYVYDKSSRLLRIETDTIINKVRTFTYDDKGRISCETGITKFHTVVSKDSLVYRYNVYDQEMESRLYLKGILESRKIYKYNENHLISKVITYTGRRKTHKSIQRTRLYEYY